MSKKENYHGIRYGNKDGELKFGHITENNQLLAFIVRSGKDPKHFIAMPSTGKDHLKHGTICRSPGSFQVKAGTNVAADVPGVWIEAESGDFVIKAAGRVRIEGENIDLRATGGDGKNGVINIDANEKVVVNGKEGVFVNSDTSVKIISENTVECIGKGILNIYGGLIDCADGATKIKGSKGGSQNEENNK